MADKQISSTIVNILSKLASLYPELRIGQILSNALGVSGIHKDLYYVTDEELAASLNLFKELIGEKRVFKPNIIEKEGAGDGGNKDM